LKATRNCSRRRGVISELTDLRFHPQYFCLLPQYTPYLRYRSSFANRNGSSIDRTRPHDYRRTPVSHRVLQTVLHVRFGMWSESSNPRMAVIIRSWPLTFTLCTDHTAYTIERTTFKFRATKRQSNTTTASSHKLQEPPLPNQIKHSPPPHQTTASTLLPTHPAAP
jgi:hypothetical protein